ncbi:uncharacterized protein LOC131231816 [Magnolia sinica]|uniref:uncharacterized protein LOC131231816 n=1 Tax=Magnolia sinica TaxID=86752 RepID=UPI00265B29AF|nr:uncharacterized protein LOC131231816 [Magnolia sinica]
MGNYNSCLFKPLKLAAKFLDSDGNLHRIGIPTKAAELMLEWPGHVICQAEELRRTRRVTAMKADEELQAGKVYLLLPVSRISSRVSEDEISRMDATCRKKKKNDGSCRVFPESERGRNEFHVAEECEERDTGFPGHRMVNYRQWRPALETINEVH